MRAVVTVRRGRYADAASAARCMSVVFRDEGSTPAMFRPLYAYLAFLDLTGQLCRRLPRLDESNVRDTNNRVGGDEPTHQSLQRVRRVDGPQKAEHVLLVAEDIDEAPGKIIGCVEMGVVNVPRLIANGMLDEIDQWGQVLRDSNTDVYAREQGRTSLESDEEFISTKSSGKNTVSAPYIGNLAVTSSFRRRGIATMLMVEAEQIGRSWGFDRICLHVDADNIPAKVFYANLGYECTLQEPQWYRRIGRLRRMFLRKYVTGNSPRARATDVNAWDQAEVSSSGKKLNFIEYLKLCYADLAMKGGRKY